jgi:hypothetical protein
MEKEWKQANATATYRDSKLAASLELAYPMAPPALSSSTAPSSMAAEPWRCITELR